MDPPVNPARPVTATASETVDSEEADRLVSLPPRAIPFPGNNDGKSRVENQKTGGVRKFERDY